ncbi:MAG: U32 family peptidase [Firmicutes bacterium]|nr:U32 family peptidase [Bacillota bacterium]
MTELLAPAGNMEALKAAISNGCDAVYLGMQKFGARAYSSNFDWEALEEAIRYAHLRDVKIFVTMNTVVYEEEMAEMKEQLHRLNEIGVDGVIVQDMAVFDYVVRNFVDLEAHCSTQMGIDDLEGTLLYKELGAKRVVLSREVPIEKVKAIRNIAQIPIEIFIHGALCMSYSGNCLMSGLTGYRCGNRGRCVGSCRKLFEVIDVTTDTSLGHHYILSTKDLNTIDYVDELREVDSLKIEGRMKEPVYVANVVSKYRKALDGELTWEDKENLKKTFNRTFTKGYLFHEDPRDISNIQKPNNFGYEIGKISGYHKGMCEITLKKSLTQNDVIRIDHENEDINLSVAKLFDKDGKLINKADKTCYIKLKEKVSVGDVVYKTKDQAYYKELESMLEREFRRYPLNLKVYAYPGSKLVIDAEGLGSQYLYESEEVLGEAMKSPTTKDQVEKQLSKLNDTIFTLGDLEFEEYNAFIPVKELNNARREIVQALYDLKVNSKERRTKISAPKAPVAFEPVEPYLTATVITREQYDACVASGIETVYFDNVVRRNQNDYQDREGELLIGGYGGIYRYRETNPFVTDYSLNVTNSTAVYELHKLGAKRVTLSYELNKGQLKDLVDTYYNENGGYPALEMIVYGRAPLLFTKYCPMRKLNQCGICKIKKYEIRDESGNFPILSHEDCTTTILNGRYLNLLDEIPGIKGVEAFRLNFTTESAEEVRKVVKMAKGKLNGTLTESVFDQKTDTRGHFNKEIV